MSAAPPSAKKRSANTIIFLLSAYALGVVLVISVLRWPPHLAICASIIFGATVISAAILDVFGEHGDVHLIGPLTVNVVTARNEDGDLAAAKPIPEDAS